MVIDDDEPMMQVENSPPEMIKSAIEAEEEVGEIKSPEQPTKKSLRDVGDISAGEGMSGAGPLISLGIPGQGSIGREVSGVNVEKVWLDAGGRDQASNNEEELQRMLALEKTRAENAEQEVGFLLGLTEKVREDGAQTEARRLQVVVNTERARVQALEEELRVEKLRAEGNDAGM